MKENHVCKTHCKDQYPLIWKIGKEEKKRLKKPKLTLKEGPMMDQPYTFTVEEEEIIKKEYEMEKQKETPKTRQVLVKMIRIKAMGSRRTSEQPVEEAEIATEEEFQDEEIPEEVDDEDENEELMEALQLALNTDEEVERTGNTS